MKFYFCEKCGKRLTDNDVDSGAAKNKRLKGVFCDACSVGVMTMETLPLTDDQAKALLTGGDPVPSANDPAAVAVPGTARRTSDAKLPPAKRAQTAERVQRGAGPHEKNNKSIIIGSMAGGVGLVLLVTVFILFTRKPPPAHTAAANATPAAKPSTTASVPMPARPIPTPLPAPMPDKPVDGPAASWPAAEPASEPVADPAEPVVPEPADEVRAGETVAMPAATGEPTPPADPVVAPPADSVVDAVVASTPEAEIKSDAYWLFTQAFFKLLSQRQVEKAQQHLEAAANNPQLTSFADELKRDALAVSWGRRLEESLEDGFKLLPKVARIELRSDDGKKMVVGTSESMKVLAVKDDRLLLGQDGLELPMLRAGLTGATLAEIARVGWQGKPDATELHAFQTILNFMTNPNRSPAHRAAAHEALAELKTPSGGDEPIVYLRDKLALMDTHQPMAAPKTKPSASSAISTSPDVSESPESPALASSLDKGLVFRKNFEGVRPKDTSAEGPGVFGKAYRFNGKPNENGGRILTGGMIRNTKETTVSLWIKREGFAKSCVILENRTRYRVGMEGRAVVWSWTQGKDAHHMSAPIPVNGPKSDWIHIAWACDGKTSVAYVNGHVVNTGKGNGGEIGAAGNGGYTLRIGGRFLFSGSKDVPTFDGWMDELRIYDRALGSAEIKELAAKP